MPLPRVSEKILTEGYRCYVRAGKNASTAKVIGFVESFRASLSYMTQEARVLGELVPVSIDAQGVSCSISMSGFLPSKDVIKNGISISKTNDVKISLYTFFPSPKSIRDDKVVTKIPYMDFKDEDNGNIVATFEGIIVDSGTISGQGSSYVKGDVSMKALDWSVQEHNNSFLK
ncbi:hypothetical protein [Treponema phagedenis]|uniref:Uncharacterized protein n=2 Tax=Treponema phagedenis TaxID=162 RepID=A0AAE6ITW2_TREPH|nr:hypothetical protein [Treponema phagedenis]QEJ98154.1 hypothetical protein FUT82_09190 [Treponema phagedenis]QEK03661.1 hypothetical protein FUT83_07495 [Treponema phagedenis]QEK09278.1 hypothetical protein FUT81_07405 [Treponema phagedenis]QSH94622.1 hypothetical protein C5O78_06140 [Treponema phagedenis]TYT77824.1 hypothetical protein FS559_01120 [Treponema phagedenis]